MLKPKKRTVSEKRGRYKTHPNEYPVYVAMKGRCLNKRKSDYMYYGGRGISLCKEWENSFEVFISDMGPRPAGTTLDRADSNGNYEPGNCRWATWDQQNNNKSNNTYITHEGVTQTLSHWSQQTGIGRSTISYRIKNGFTVPEALGFDRMPNKSEMRERRNLQVLCKDCHDRKTKHERSLRK